METLELKDFARIIFKRKWLVLSLVVVITLLTGGYKYYSSTPLFSASAKLIVNRSDAVLSSQQQLNPAEINANILLINTYKEIIKTHAIMDKVVAAYPDLHLTPEELIGRVNVSSVNNTQVMTVSVVDPSYQKAVKIVNAVSVVFQQSIPTIMKIDNVEILNEAGLTDHPRKIGTSPVKSTLITFIISILIGIGVAYLLEYLDESVRTESEIYELTGAPTLAFISIIKAKDIRSGKSSNKRFEEVSYATVNQ